MKKSIATAFICLFVLFACSENKSAELIKQINTTKTYDGKKVELEGRISVGSSLQVKSDNTVTITFQSSESDGTPQLIPLNLKNGEKKHGIIVNANPDGTFDNSQVKIYDDNGKELGPGSKAKLTATVHYADSDQGEITPIFEDVKLVSAN